MKFFLMVSTSLIACRLLSASEAEIVPANSPLLRVEGRCGRSADGRLLMGFPGITIHLRVEGTGVNMQVNASCDACFFDVSVDGGPAVKLNCHKGDGDYPLLTDVPSGTHTLEITRRIESWQGTCQLEHLTLAQGARLLPPAPLPSRKLLCIGDSITCGAGAGEPPSAGETDVGFQSSNARNTFGRLLAARLDAQCHLVSYGGRGIARDRLGTLNINNAPEFYELTLPDDPSSRWNPADYVPDVVIICLGTNDFGQGIPDQNLFVNSYAEFVRKVRRDAPDAAILLADSPMIEDIPGGLPRRAVLHAYLQEIIGKLRDLKVTLAPISYYPGVPGDGHPTHTDHEGISVELESVIRETTGWK
jgi:lysophospholipase L1-like esterase